MFVHEAAFLSDLDFINSDILIQLFRGLVVVFDVPQEVKTMRTFCKNSKCRNVISKATCDFETYGGSFAAQESSRSFGILVFSYESHGWSLVVDG